MIVEESISLPPAIILLCVGHRRPHPNEPSAQRINAFQTEALAFVHEQLYRLLQRTGCIRFREAMSFATIRAARTILCLRRDAMLDARDSLHQFAVGAKVTQGDRIGGG